ncbi:hypothetical protein FCM35_KLT04772 [Carex littledalei]|uniref:Uncharacterized protein n=1 Tax=Carex littledalei TaxID=544730 RepID=A0A833V981_9POAL|nr:hypothetical protein FCM35_KLT04772 [Carex littledalei]
MRQRPNYPEDNHSPKPTTPIYTPTESHNSCQINYIISLMKYPQTLPAIAIAVVSVILTLINDVTVAFAENHHTDISPPPSSYINTPPPPPLKLLPSPMNPYPPVVKVVGRVYCYRCYNQQEPAKSHDKKGLEGT